MLLVDVFLRNDLRNGTYAPQNDTSTRNMYEVITAQHVRVAQGIIEGRRCISRY